MFVLKTGYRGKIKSEEGEELCPITPLQKFSVFLQAIFQSKRIGIEQSGFVHLITKSRIAQRIKQKTPWGFVVFFFENDNAVITCPIRFRQDWIIADHAASFFFPPNANWTSLTEVRLPDKHGRSAGNIDVVLVSYNEHGRIIDFGALEVQAVCISGNIRNAFAHYMQSPETQHEMVWEGQYYPRPDYLSSSRKRLAPQLIYKGGILNKWGKKMSAVVDKHFFANLPTLPETDPENADIAWLVYELVLDPTSNSYALKQNRVVYTAFTSALETITTAEAGSVDDFMETLQHKLDEKLEDGTSPDAPTLADIFKD